MSDKAQYGESGKPSHYFQMSDIDEEAENEQIDEEDKDQNEEELEKLRPQIILDQSAQQDRDDEPSFDQEDNENGHQKQRGKEAKAEIDDYDE